MKEHKIIATFPVQNSCQSLRSSLLFLCCTPKITNLRTMQSSCSSLNDSLYYSSLVSLYLQSRVHFLLAWQMCCLTTFQAQMFPACPIGTFRYLVQSGAIKQTALRGLFARDREQPPFTTAFYKICLCYIFCYWEKERNNTAKCQSCQETQSLFIVPEIMETSMQKINENGRSCTENEYRETLLILLEKQILGKNT